MDADEHGPDRTTELVRRGLAVFLAGATAAHVVRPNWFVPMIPDWVPGDPSLVHAAATVNANGCAADSSRSSFTFGGFD